MTDDYKKIAESIRSGKYFSDARSWFEAVYIGPISERTFFLLIAILAGLVGLFGIMSVSRLLPVTTHEPVLLHASERADDVQMSLVSLAPNHAAINPAISEFFLARYVQLRESFDSRTFTNNALFIQTHSDANAYTAYANAYDPHNAQSPFAPLGDFGQRLVTVESVRHVDTKQVEGQAPLPANVESAIVTFSTETTGVSDPVTTKWTANIDYIYTGLESKMVVNPETKEEELAVADPHFQVVNYVLQEQTRKAR